MSDGNPLLERVVGTLTLEEVYSLFLAAYAQHLDTFRSIKMAHMNEVLFDLVVRGLGILNYENNEVSGEQCFLGFALGSQAKPVVLDVGANVGNYSRLVKAVNRDADVYAFEPSPGNFEKLSELAREIGVRAFNCGCSDKSGRSELYDYGDKEASSHASLYRGVIEDLHHAASRSDVVDLIVLDDFLRDSSIESVQLLKIDTEGHELAVLAGARSAIDQGRVDVIHIEFNEMNVYSRTFFKDVFDFLPGYSFFRMLPDGLLPIREYNPLKCELFAFQNIAAVREGCDLLQRI